MKAIRFNESQMVKIENKDQFDVVCDSLKYSRCKPFEIWERETYGTYPNFPVYLRKLRPPFNGIGIIIAYVPEEGCEVLTFEEAGLKYK